MYVCVCVMEWNGVWLPRCFLLESPPAPAPLSHTHTHTPTYIHTHTRALLLPPLLLRDTAAPATTTHQVIGHLIRKEGLVAITGAPKRQAGEDDDGFRNRLLKERRLALSANFVPE